VLEGVLKHAFPYMTLKAILDKNLRLDRIPQGYLYPELLISAEMPRELFMAIANKNKN